MSEAESTNDRLGVDACAVGIRDIDVEVRHRLACFDVCDLDVEEEIKACLAFANVLADEHAVER